MPACIARRDAAIVVSNGPESIVVDGMRGRVYTHHWQSSTMSIDVRTRKITPTGDGRRGFVGAGAI